MERSSHAVEYNVSTFGRTTLRNDAAGELKHMAEIIGWRAVPGELHQNERVGKGISGFGDVADFRSGK